jgi:hypothetical protein
MRRLFALLLVGCSITAACVIGPKHDDPEADLGADAGMSEDSSFSADTTPGTAADTGSADNVDAFSGGGDATKTEDGSADSTGDAPTDGSTSDAPADAVGDASDAAEGG